jgi:hypothetical protein
MKFRAPFAAVCSAFLAFNATAATTHYVSLSNTAPMSPFTNWVTAATNIQDAIDAANADDFIVVTDGTYNTGGRAVYGLATNRVTLDKAVTVQSVNGPGTTVIAGAGNSRHSLCLFDQWRGTDRIYFDERGNTFHGRCYKGTKRRRSLV